MDNNKVFDNTTPRVFTTITLKNKIGLRLRITAEFLNINLNELVDILLDHADIPHVYSTHINQEDKEKFTRHFKNLSQGYAIEKEKYFKGGFRYHKRKIIHDL